MPHDKDTTKRVGALIIFPEGVSKQEADRLLHLFADKALLNGVSISTHEYNPNWGGPVWYIP